MSILDEIGADVPIVVLEPSCASVFREELKNLLANDQSADQLARRTFLLGEFLDKYAPSFSPPKLNPSRKALVHGHCHQKAVMSMDAEIKWLEKTGVDAELLDSGCCGMAGSFGFEKEKYEVSVKCGELVLLPKVREADLNTLIVANGFSCQEQIAQLTNRHALHLAQVIQMAFRPETEKGPYPESAWVQSRQSKVTGSMRRSAIALAGVSALGIASWAISRRSS